MAAVNEKEIAEAQKKNSEFLNSEGKAVKIIDGIFVGNQITALNAKSLQSQGITHILSICKMKPQFEDLFTYKVFELEDSFSVDLLSHLDETKNFIDKVLCASSNTSDKQYSILIHDENGLSLAPAVIIAYIMNKKKLSYRDGFNFVFKKYDACGKMNMALTYQLKTYAKLNYKVNGDTQEHLKRRVEKLGSIMLEKHFIKSELFASDPEYVKIKISNSEIPSSKQSTLSDKDFELDDKGRPIINSILNTIKKENSSSSKSQSSSDSKTSSSSESSESSESSINNTNNSKKENLLYSCLSCKRRLFTSRNRFDVDHNVQLAQIGGGECMYHFIEPIQWMDDSDAGQGWIFCPKCKEMIGMFNWYGTECCTISFRDPAFAIQKFSVSAKVIESIQYD